MIQPSENHAADDLFTIQCRVRRSAFASNPQFEAAREMTCTMRSWEAHGAFEDEPLTAALYPPTAALNEPELLLRALPSAPMGTAGEFSERFQSFGSSNNLKRRASERFPRNASSNNMRRRATSCIVGQNRQAVAEEPPPKPISIPMSDVVVVDTHQHAASANTRSDKNNNNADVTCILFLTTISNGYWEFSFAGRNAHDCLVAFLAAHLPAERIVSQQESSCERSAFSEQCSFDLDTFTAERMQERVRSESFAEKMQRKMARFAMCIGEMSSAFSECAACGCGPSAVSPTKEMNGVQDDERRDSPPRDLRMEFSEGNMLEYSQSNSVADISRTSQDTTGAATKTPPPPPSHRLETEPELQAVS